MSDTPDLIFLEDMDDKRKPPGFFRLYGKLLVFLVLVVLAVIAFFLVTQGALSYRRAGAEYDRLKTAYVRVLDNAYEADPEAEYTPSERPYYPGRPAGAVLDIDFDALCKVNRDCVAWLHVPVLDISYPVTATKDREYYTNHTFEGMYNTNGALFVEPCNAQDFSDRNTFLYGHNSADGSMFGSLHRLVYADTQVQQNPFVYVYLKDGEVRRYRIYSFYVAKEDGESFRTIEEEDYEAYVRYTKESALTQLPADFDGQPLLLTLSTCYGNTGTDERFLVHAVRVP